MRYERTRTRTPTHPVLARTNVAVIQAPQAWTATPPTSTVSLGAAPLREVRDHVVTTHQPRWPRGRRRTSCEQRSIAVDTRTRSTCDCDRCGGHPPMATFMATSLGRDHWGGRPPCASPAAAIVTILPSPGILGNGLLSRVDRFRGAGQLGASRLLPGSGVSTMPQWQYAGSSALVLAVPSFLR